MIVCPKCGKENQDHYKFCLGCGSELPRDAAAPQRSFSTPTPPAGMPVSQPPDMGAPAMPSGDQAAFAATGAAPALSPPVGAPPAPAGLAPSGAPGMRSCPSCGTENPANFKFCGACGANLEVAAPAAGAPAPAPAPEMPADDGSAAGYLVLIRPDGSEGGAFPLGDGATSVGRSTGQLFAADAYLSPLHATFVMSSGKLIVRDEGSLNGIFVRIPAEQPQDLQAGDVLRLGQELVEVEELPDPDGADDGTETMGSALDEEVWGRVSLVVGKGQVANSFALCGDGVVLGRERGNVLFPEDGYVSGTHLRLQRQGDQIVATDLNSSNGTFLKVRGEQDLSQGDYILMGQQLFRVDF